MNKYCIMRFGSWTYDGLQVDLQHQKQTPNSTLVPIGINHKEYYPPPSCKWQILASASAVPAQTDPQCAPSSHPRPRISFTLFLYTADLITPPCVGLSFLTVTVLVFSLSSSVSGAKMSLVISSLLSVFFLSLAEIVPPTCVEKYYLFRSFAAHASCVRCEFIHTLLPCGPRDDHGDEGVKILNGCSGGWWEFPDASRDSSSFRATTSDEEGDGRDDVFVGQESDYGTTSRQCKYLPEVQKAIRRGQSIAQCVRNGDSDPNAVEDWNYVSTILDRMFLWILAIAGVVGTCSIIFQAPSLYDDRIPIDGLFSETTRKI